VGKSLGESRLGSALGINVLGIIRDGQTQLSPDPGTLLQTGDRLLVAGDLDRLDELRGRPHLVPEEDKLAVEKLGSTQIEVAELSLSPHSSFLGQTLQQLDFRRRFGVNVLAIRRGGVPMRINLQDVPLQLDDTLLIQGPPAQLDVLRDAPDVLVSDVEAAQIYRLHERLLIVRVPPDSTLVGRTLAESRLGDAFGLTVLSIVREGMARLVPEATDQLMAGDTLLVEGKPEDLLTLNGLPGLEIDRRSPPDLGALESEQVGLMEVVLSPRTTLAGQSLRQIHFREKYGLNVLAIWRQGQAYHTNLRDMALRFGDALLLYGPRDKMRVLGSEPDFLVLTEEAQEAPRLKRAPVAALVMGAVLLPVILGWLPISISAVVGASLMVLTGCLTMEEAYRSIEWKAVFLIAGMLPLGIAMQQTGAARFLADGVVATVGGLGPLAVVAGLFVLTTLATQVMPNPAVAVLLAPIALSTANDLGMSPYALMMTIALAASASFLSPVSHPANVLIMGPGGYRFMDYIRVGLPLSLVVLVITLLVLPIFWPLFL
jgi:di/tricarboxylate transporter